MFICLLTQQGYELRLALPSWPSSGPGKGPGPLRLPRVLLSGYPRDHPSMIHGPAPQLPGSDRWGRNPSGSDCLSLCALAPPFRPGLEHLPALACSPHCCSRVRLLTTPRRRPLAARAPFGLAAPPPPCLRRVSVEVLGCPLLDCPSLPVALVLRLLFLLPPISPSPSAPFPPHPIPSNPTA